MRTEGYIIKDFCRKKTETGYLIFPKRKSQVQVIEINEVGNDILLLLEKHTPIDKLEEEMSLLYSITEKEREFLIQDIDIFLNTIVSSGLLECDRKGEKEIKSAEDSVNRESYLQTLYAKEKRPYKFFVELTYSCGLMCRHCYISEEISEARQKPMFLETKRVKQLFDEIEEMDAVEVFLTGGELFLHPDIYEILEYAAKKNFLTTVLTNGNYINSDEAIDKLKDLSIYDYRISLYGNEEAHDKMTQVRGSFQKSLGALKRIKKTMGIGTGVYVVTNENYYSRNELLGILRNESIDYSINTYLSPTSERNLFPLEFRINMEQIDEIYRENNLSVNGTICVAGLSRFRISPSGELNPCELIRDVSFGNIYEMTLKEIMASEYRRDFVNELQAWSNEHECSKCDEKGYCTFCPASFWIETGNKKSAPKYICDATKVKKRVVLSRQVTDEFRRN